MTTRVQLSRKRGAKLPPGTVVVSRPSRWGNPFDWREMGGTPTEQKAQAQRLYKKWLDGDFVSLPLRNRRQWILDNIHTIRAAEYVACWCGPSDNCHADILIKLSEAL